MKGCVAYKTSIRFRFESKPKRATHEKSLSCSLSIVFVHGALADQNCCEGCKNKLLKMFNKYADCFGGLLQLRLAWKGASETAKLRLGCFALHSFQKHSAAPLQVRVTLKNILVRSEDIFPTEEYRDVTTIYESQEMTIRPGRTVISLTEGICKDNRMKIPDLFKHYANKEELSSVVGSSMECSADVIVEISDCGFKTSGSACHVSTSDNTGPSLKWTLEKAQEEDFIIVCEGTVEVKCFKAALAERSPVFKAMLSTDCKESLENKMELLDHSPDVVKAFLDYVHHGDFAYALTTSKCAFMLLEMADKYHVESLMTALKYIITTKPVDWFDVGIAFQLYYTFGCLPGFGDTKKKAVQVMKTKHDELKEDEAYKEFMGILTNAIELNGEFAKG